MLRTVTLHDWEERPDLLAHLESTDTSVVCALCPAYCELVVTDVEVECCSQETREV